MTGFSVNAHWRDSARRPRFLMFDARATFPLMLLLFHIRIWTLVVAVLGTTFFGMLERYGFTVDVFIRWTRTILAGKRKMAVPWWRD